MGIGAAYGRLVLRPGAPLLARVLLSAPADGVYTFHAPRDYYQLDQVAGYEIQIRVDGELWQPSGLRQWWGAWCVPLAKGLHGFEVNYADVRGATAKLELAGEMYTVRFDRTGKIPARSRRTFPELTLPVDLVWTGVTPVLEISGPGLRRQPVPSSLLFRSRD